jgi:hypothetical protein
MSLDTIYYLHYFTEVMCIPCVLYSVTNVHLFFVITGKCVHYSSFIGMNSVRKFYVV